MYSHPQKVGWVIIHINEKEPGGIPGSFHLYNQLFRLV